MKHRKLKSRSHANLRTRSSHLKRTRILMDLRGMECHAKILEPWNQNSSQATVKAGIGRPINRLRVEWTKNHRNPSEGGMSKSVPSQKAMTSSLKALQECNNRMSLLGVFPSEKLSHSNQLSQNSHLDMDSLNQWSSPTNSSNHHLVGACKARNKKKNENKHGVFLEAGKNLLGPLRLPLNDHGVSRRELRGLLLGNTPRRSNSRRSKNKCHQNKSLKDHLANHYLNLSNSLHSVRPWCKSNARRVLANKCHLVSNKDPLNSSHRPTGSMVSLLDMVNKGPTGNMAKGLRRATVNTAARPDTDHPNNNHLRLAREL
mmetsp:Transcript_77473/g.224799  ORF Transcript_77473/g.224799 Transcript_77473/m.224799 type:complete len:316 (-) Transcript_77473:863-1810(-)